MTARLPTDVASPLRISAPATVLLAALLLCPGVSGQTPYSSEQIRQMVSDFKDDPKGPFQIVRWFCPDGTVIAARERCAEPGGQQHAVAKDIVQRLQVRNRIYLGQILAGTEHRDFLDEGTSFSRLKQYQLEKYLSRIDDGWIFRKARYYRGAYQVEDEEAWGLAFLREALMREALVRSRFFLLREAVRDLPHGRTDDIMQRSRALSQEIADAYPRFLDIRVKIHGQPDASDVDLVAEFRRTEGARVPPEIKARLDNLYENLQRQYSVNYSEQLAIPLSKIRRATTIAADVRAFDISSADAAERVAFFADVMERIRSDFGTYSRPSERVALLDLSLISEAIIFRNAPEWKPATRGDLIEKVAVLRSAAFGAGLLETWEYNKLEQEQQQSDETALSAAAFAALVDQYERSVEWSAATVFAHYRDVVDLFSPFEPLAEGFVDDRIRGSVLLPFGDAASRLSEDHARLVNLANEVLELDASSVRGLNPGVAIGTLDVVTGNVDEVDFKSDHIYVMLRTPSELKPVAGIATVSEGNMVSHVQLLARNLGIPNAVFPQELVGQLARYSGQRVFYAISPGGRVRMKFAKAMSAEEKALVETRERAETLVRVPTNRLDLADKRLTSLFDLRATDSGRVCGPKAANLGQLSMLFPGRVAPGFIVPFGLFREHMDQRMPDSDRTYWQELQSIFAAADKRRKEGVAADQVDNEVLASLATLRAAIEVMPLTDAFRANLQKRFAEVFGAPLGRVPVFVRSDTNMEDLKDFTGAGLNLTVPNVVTEASIADAIRRVWASPFRERGYRWRQKYLLNPEDVYPSLLILKSVNVQKSGVMITAGVSTGTADDYTVAFNRGVGGAVDGQAAETYLLRPDGSNLLLAPAREPSYSILPPTGGVEKRTTPFDERILTPSNLDALREVGAEIRRVLPGQPGIETDGPFDVELGFDKASIVLFQARPFVQNRNAGSVSYLTTMDRTSSSQNSVRLDERLK